MSKRKRWLHKRHNSVFHHSMTTLLDSMLDEHVMSADRSNWWAIYYVIKTKEGLKRYSFIWGSHTGWNVYKRDFIKNTPSVFVCNGLMSYQSVVTFVKSISAIGRINRDQCMSK